MQGGYYVRILLGLEIDSQAIDRQRAQVYRVTSQSTGVRVLVLAGRDAGGVPALCGSTTEHVPVWHSINVKRQTVNLGSNQQMNLFLGDPGFQKGNWQGWGTVGGIPSARTTTFSFPLQIVRGHVILPLGRNQEYGVIIERL